MRKRRRSSNGCLMTLLIILIILVVAVGGALFWLRSETGGNRGGQAQNVTIAVEAGSSSLTIGRQLQEAGVIRNAQLFRFYVRYKEMGSTLQYGTFTFSTDMSYDTIIETLQELNKERNTVMVTFPEGIPAVQFASRMESAGLCTAEEFLEVANNGDFSQFKFWNLRDENPNQFMEAEGFLFPETYEFFVDDTVYNMVAKIYGEFDKRFTDEMYAQIQEMGFTLSEFVTLASIVQEEAGGVDHQADVAAVFMNRLAPDSIEDRLQSNTSSYIQNPDDNNYLLNTIAQYYGGWENIPPEIIDHYDTYKKAGLPAGPISNPGIDAMLNTIAYDRESPYYFFVTDLTGTYYFGRTANEHAANCDKAWAVDASLK